MDKTSLNDLICNFRIFDSIEVHIIICLSDTRLEKVLWKFGLYDKQNFVFSDILRILYAYLKIHGIDIISQLVVQLRSIYSDVNQSIVKRIYVLTSYTYFSYLAKVEVKVWIRNWACFRCIYNHQLKCRCHTLSNNRKL